ncbi:MAG: allantoate amidohydrolase, partial [Micromonosporaceae bacterium]|nr:allantoate amidohydrolase [Micromonosporaceae bacterium]
VLDPARAAGLRDGAGISLAEAIRATGADPAGLGPDPALLRRIGAFVELHVEQGRALAGRPGGPAGRSAPVGVASRIWPHGRWRLEFRGEGNHAGTTAMGDRHDPMLTYAYTVLAANKEARLAGGYATIARTTIEPGATNAIPSRVDAWLDARAPSTMELEKLVAAIASRAADRAGRDGTGFTMSEESCSPAVEFDPALRDRLVSILDGAPVLPTGAGHDAGVLAARLPTAMLFVRNPTGVSHAPAEYATDEDCAAGVEALAAVLADLATGTDPAANSDLATGTDRAGNTDPAADTHRAGNSDPAGNTDPAGNSGLAGG